MARRLISQDSTCETRQQINGLLFVAIVAQVNVHNFNSSTICQLCYNWIQVTIISIIAFTFFLMSCTGEWFLNLLVGVHTHQWQPPLRTVHVATKIWTFTADFSQSMLCTQTTEPPDSISTTKSNLPNYLHHTVVIFEKLLIWCT